jgi:hypothetical protein
VPALALLARQRDRGADTLRHEFHQALDHPLVRVDPGTGQHFAPVTGPRPPGDLFRPVAVFLVIGNRIVEGSEDDGGEEFARALALLVVECGAVNEIAHFVWSFFIALASVGVRPNMSNPE